MTPGRHCAGAGGACAPLGSALVQAAHAHHSALQRLPFGGRDLRLIPCITVLVCACADIAVVEEGRVHQPASRRLPFGGRDLTEHLARLLHLGGARGGALPRAEREALERAKVGCMRVLDSKEELAAASSQVGAAWSQP